MRDSSVPSVAEYQHGVFTRAQARAAGWTDRQVRRRVGAGHWVRIAGVALGHKDLGIGPRALASAALLTWPGAVISHQLAGALWDLPVPPTSVATVTVRPELVLRGYRLKPRRSALAPDDICDYAGLQVTTRGRTALDLLALLPWPDARNLWAWLVTRRVMDRSALVEAVKHRKHLGGTLQLRRLVEASSTGSLSEAEDVFHDLLHKARIGGWTANAPIVVRGLVLGIADVLFDEERVVAEVDGWATHGDRRSFQRDRTRQNGLVAAGYVVLRFTWEDLTTRPAYVVGTVRAALARTS